MPAPLNLVRRIWRVTQGALSKLSSEITQRPLLRVKKLSQRTRIQKWVLKQREASTRLVWWIRLPGSKDVLGMAPFGKKDILVNVGLVTGAVSGGGASLERTSAH